MDVLFKYDCNLNIDGFIHMLDDPTECYKFYWMDAVMQLVAEGRADFTFDEVISGMIADAWYSVAEYHLCMGTKGADGISVNSIERAVNKLNSLGLLDFQADRTRILSVIGENHALLHDEMYQISKNVPYRVLSPFLTKIGGNDKLWDQRKRLISYIELINNESCLPYIIKDGRSLNKMLHVNEQWYNFFQDNLVAIRGWIQMKKVKYLQDRNPGVPGIVYKLEPENEKRRKLQNVRKLWSSVIDIVPVRDIYSGGNLKQIDYEIDHFVPWSYISNDEMWNLMPADASLNSSKRDRLPKWDKYFKSFAQNQYLLNVTVYRYPKVRKVFEGCRKDNLNSLWSTEELYVRGIEQEKFEYVLENRLKPIYDLAHIQGYGIWAYEGEI